MFLEVGSVIILIQFEIRGFSVSKRLVRFRMLLFLSSVNESIYASCAGGEEEWRNSFSERDPSTVKKSKTGTICCYLYHREPI